MEHEKTCPVCGGVKVEGNEEREAVTVPYGPVCTFLRSVHQCSECGERGDFSNVNDSRLEKALEIAVRASVASMIDELSRRGFSMAYLERALELPQRTLARWKTGECSASAVALLRILRTYPWIGRVAESGYDERCAKSLLVSEAVVVFEDLAKQAGLATHARVDSGADSVRITAEFTESRLVADVAPADTAIRHWAPQVALS
jgi:hypothetical protein